ncbi:MAG: hypothetical protein IKE66_09970 [Hyphomicrobium sp.]|nr:hypothetical protein [Hyphomicrobium sp.]
MSDLHIIIAESGIILARGADMTFREFQDIYPDFMTSLGPMDRDGVFDTFEIEWPDILVINHDTIRTFVDAQGNDRKAEVRLAMNGGPP